MVAVSAGGNGRGRQGRLGGGRRALSAALVHHQRRLPALLLAVLGDGGSGGGGGGGGCGGAGRLHRLRRSLRGHDAMVEHLPERLALHLVDVGDVLAQSVARSRRCRAQRTDVSQVLVQVHVHAQVVGVADELAALRTLDGKHAPVRLRQEALPHGTTVGRGTAGV